MFISPDLSEFPSWSSSVDLSKSVQSILSEASTLPNFIDGLGYWPWNRIDGLGYSPGNICGLIQSD